MTRPAHDPERDVTLLMMVRLMPEADFQALCNSVLKGEPFTQGSTLDGDEYSNRSEPLRTAANRDGLLKCLVCGSPGPLWEGSTIGACRACIDDTVWALYGP